MECSKKKQQYGSMYDQAHDILSAMGLDPKPSIEGSSMYVFEYKDTTMFLDIGENDHDIDLLCPIHLYGTAKQQKQLLEDAKDMAENDLLDYDICYIRKNLAFIALYLQVKKTRHKLYKKHLVSMLDKQHEGYTTLMCAISLVMYTLTPEFLASITDDKN